MKNKILDKDKKDWEDFLSKNDRLYNKDLVNIEKKNFKTKSIDLHGFTLEKANKLIEKFIINSQNDGVSKLTVVTGKGLHSQNEKNPYVSKDLSILRFSVPEFIKNTPELMKLITEIKEAEIKDGGSGAFYIFLKKRK